MGNDEDKLGYSVIISFESSMYRKLTRQEFFMDGGETIDTALDMLIGPMLRAIGYSDKTICDGMCRFIDS